MTPEMDKHMKKGKLIKKFMHFIFDYESLNQSISFEITKEDLN
jgi:hypothetical protein